MAVRAMVFPADRRRCSPWNVIGPSKSTVAMGASLMLRKASLREVCILRTLVPLWTAATVSELVPCMSTTTSAASVSTMKRAADSRLV